MLALLPVVLHLAGRGGEGLLLVLVLAAAPAAFGLLARRQGAGASAEAAFLTAFGAAFVTPLLPTILGVEGFAAAAVAAHGALAYLAWTSGAWRAVRREPAADGPLARRVRVVLCVWAAWSIGSALRGLLAYLPVDAPWLGDMLVAAALDPFGYASLVDPLRPLSQLFLRLETLAFLWAGVEVFLAARRRGAEAELEARLVACLKWILVAGLVAGVAEFAAAAIWRGDASVLERARAGIGRNNRPLLDHNALGTVLVLLVPLAAAELLGRGERLLRALGDARAWLAFAASGLGALLALVLLVSSRSKSALAGTGLALLVFAGLWVVRRGGPVRRLFLGVVAAGGLALLAFNLAPAGPGSAVDRLASTRYGHDVVRVLRFDAAAEYVGHNRATIWRGARAVGAEHPLVGVGLGRLPSLLPEHHDPSDPGWFNPRSENAHSQFLQWRAEEGWLGLGLALLVLCLAIWGGVRRGLGGGVGPGSEARPGVASIAGAAGLVGMLLNLAVGHALLMPAVAFLVAGVLGWLLALGGAPRPTPASPELEPLGVRAALLPGAALFAAFVPLLLPGGRRPLPLADHTMGCFAWDFLREQVPDRARSLGPDARWFEVWGEGDVMKLPVRDVRDPRFEEPHRLTVEANGEVVVEDFRLPHRTLVELAANPDLLVNPPAYLRIPRPAGVEAGDLVELRLRSSAYFVGSRVFHPDHRRFAVRAWPAFFQ
ncbi:MAG: O-antigen ligase family protein [Planctomycetota bacterium]|nr:O-antigen ligase family protein [Planctomycetota bacterium]